MTTCVRCCWCVLLLVLACGSLWADEGVVPLKRPRDVALSHDGARLYVLNRGGSVQVIDPREKRVVHERPLGQRPSDLCVHLAGDQETLLITDEQTHRLYELRWQNGSLVEIRSLAVAPYPVHVISIPEQHRIAITSLWSRRLTLLDTSAEPWREAQVIDLPFAPREQIALPDGERLMVFDSFGGKLACVNLASNRIEFQREMPGHNVRGLTLNPEKNKLLAAHQMLNPHAHVNQSDIHWGLVMSNDLRWMSLASLLNPATEIYAGGRVHPLGIPGHGGGDPAGVAINSRGVVIVCLAGVDEIMIGTKDDLSLLPVPVGNRPTAVCLSADGETAYVANTFGESISVIDMRTYKVTATITIGPRRERTYEEQGEELFYDAKLSHEGWMSCHSCHVDGHSNFGRNDNLSDGGFGSPKFVPSLLGSGRTAPYAWNGTVHGLREQAENSIRKTMQTDQAERPASTYEALADYVASLEPPPSLPALRGEEDEALVEQGAQIFEQRKCYECHAPPSFTSEQTADVGLRDESGNKRFNPPSLRGVSQRDAYLHDGRAVSLEAVLLQHGHPQPMEWSADEVRQLVAFLRSL